MQHEISIEDMLALRQVIRPGILLLLIVHMGELPNTNRLARMLALDYRTVRRYLDQLIGLGYIVHQSHQNVYLLADPLQKTHQRVLWYYGWSHPTGT